ncbi:hypothetical protein TrCOL_g8528 [Triparma columacea]|uniref:Uncharacterized protein n=1 Tax=Triparma columacea TaxID=722753 RepID=A0A9W7GH69_9STRA|nr:hypothetical protein TrCOL_g8528 [Triparma columacea]
MAHLLRPRLEESDYVVDSASIASTSQSSFSSPSFVDSGQVGGRVKGMDTHISRQSRSRMLRVSQNTTADFGRRTSLAMLSPGPLEGGGVANITSIIREDDDMDDENIRNWDSSIELRHDMPRGRGAFDPVRRVPEEKRVRAQKQQRDSLRHPMDMFKEEVTKRTGGGVNEIPCSSRIRIDKFLTEEHSSSDSAGGRTKSGVKMG